MVSDRSTHASVTQLKYLILQIRTSKWRAMASNEARWCVSGIFESIGGECFVCKLVDMYKKWEHSGGHNRSRYCWIFIRVLKNVSLRYGILFSPSPITYSIIIPTIFCFKEIAFDLGLISSCMVIELVRTTTGLRCGMISYYIAAS